MVADQLAELFDLRREEKGGGAAAELDLHHLGAVGNVPGAHAHFAVKVTEIFRAFRLVAGDNVGAAAVEALACSRRAGGSRARAGLGLRLGVEV